MASSVTSPSWSTGQPLESGDSLLAWVDPADGERFVTAISRALANGGTLDLRCRVVQPYGHHSRIAAAEAALSGSGEQLVKILGVPVRIYPEPAAPEPAARERRYRRFFDEDISGDFLVSADGTIIECNPAFVQILGFASPAEVTGWSLASFFPQAVELERLLELLRFEPKLRDLAVELRRRDGTPVHVIMSLIGTFDEAERLSEIQGYLIDVTQHRQVEEQFRQAQKMEAVGRLAGGIAHDFNNFLTVIRGNVEMLLADLDPDFPLRGDLEEIKSTSDRAAALVRQLLTFSRRQVIQPKVLDLRGLLLTTDKMLRRLIGEHIELVTRCEPQLGFIKGDPGQIEQVIVNLVVNARDAMPTGGRLVIEARNCELHEAETRRFGNHLRPGPYVEIRVTDSGTGMDEETLSRIFEPFFTTKEQGKGTGLGLPTVYGIVKQSGGYVWAESTVGRGSTFRFYLPRVEQDAGHAEHGVITAAAPAGTQTILIIEDDDSVRTLARKVLQRSGYWVLEARDGSEALRIAEQHEDTIHLLLTDMMLRQMNGRDLAERVAALRPGLKVIYTSGYTREMIAANRTSGGDVFLQKPFTPEELTITVQEVLNRASSVM